MLGEVPRDAVGGPCFWLQLKAADEEAADLLAKIKQVVRVAHDRRLFRQLVAGNVPRGDVLVHHRHHWREGADHGGESRRPLAGGVDDDRRLHGAFVGLDMGDRTGAVGSDAGDAAVRLDDDTQFAGALGELERDAVGIHPAIVGNVHRTHDAVRVDERHDVECLLGGDGADVEADPARAADLPLQRLEPIRAGGQAQAADLVPADAVGALGLELVVQPDAVVHQLHQRGRGAELADEAD